MSHKIPTKYFWNTSRKVFYRYFNENVFETDFSYYCLMAFSSSLKAYFLRLSVSFWYCVLSSFRPTYSILACSFAIFFPKIFKEFARLHRFFVFGFINLAPRQHLLQIFLVKFMLFIAKNNRNQ